MGIKIKREDSYQKNSCFLGKGGKKMKKILMILFSTMLIFGAVSNIQAATVNMDLMVNGDFDSGPGSPWVEYSNQGYQLISENSGLPLGITPHSGSYVAWLGGGMKKMIICIKI